MKISIIISLILIQVISCNENKEICDTTRFKELKMYPIQFTLKVPEYKVTDSTRFGGKENIYDIKIRTLDSNLIIFASLTNYTTYVDESFNINYRMDFERQEIEHIDSSKKLIKEAFKTIDTIKVGYLKYLDSKKKRFESRIFFYKDKKLADIWLFENNVTESKENFSVIDCILENLTNK
jgi:hypothetical protein